MSQFWYWAIVAVGLLQVSFASDDDHHNNHHGHGPASKDRLVGDLLKDYHSSVEPSGRLELKLGVKIICARYNTDKHQLTINDWEKFQWTDYRLSWDPKDYDGVEVLRIPASLVWKPDIDCYEAIEWETRSNENVYIEHDGTVYWVPRTTYKTLCATVDGKPVCHVSLGSWVYDERALHLEIDGDGVSLSDYLNDTCPWSVEKFTSELKTTIYPCCEDPFSTLEFNLHLKPHEAEKKENAE